MKNPSNSDNAAARGMTLKQKRELAKTCMLLCMGVLIVTGVAHTRQTRQVHKAAGWAMAGASAYHASLY